MKLAIASILTLATSAFAVSAGEVAPMDVSYVDGAVEQSLSGAAGDPAKGREIVGSKKLGNC